MVMQECVDHPLWDAATQTDILPQRKRPNRARYVNAGRLASPDPTSKPSNLNGDADTDVVQNENPLGIHNEELDLHNEELPGEELELFTIERRPSIRETPPRFAREESSFLRMYLAKKEMFDRGKISSVYCSYKKPHRKAQTIEKQLGIVVAWPRVRERSWGVIS